MACAGVHSVDDAILHDWAGLWERSVAGSGSVGSSFVRRIESKRGVGGERGHGKLQRRPQTPTTGGGGPGSSCRDEGIQTWHRPSFGSFPDYISREQWESLPETLSVRYVRRIVKRKGFRDQEIMLATTLADEAAEKLLLYDSAQIRFEGRNQRRSDNMKSDDTTAYPSAIAVYPNGIGW